MKKTNIKLNGLPNALYVNNDIDTQLFASIFEQSSQSRAYSKKIIKIIQREIPRSHDERLRIISKSLYKQKFRLKWYGEMDTKKSYDKGWGLFFQLINSWFKQYMPNLNTMDSEAVQTLFCKNPKNRSEKYILPTAIPYFLESAFEEKIDPNAIALFLWAYSEAAVWRGFSYGQFDEANIFSDQPKVNEYGLKVRELYSPKEMFDHVDVPIKKMKDNVSKNKSIIKKENKNVEVQEVLDSHKENYKYFEELRISLNIVKDKCSNHHKMIDYYIIEHDKLKSNLSSFSAIYKVKELMSEIEEDLILIHESMKAYMAKAEETIEHIGDKGIGQTLLIKGSLVSEMESIKEWLHKKEREFEDIVSCKEVILKYVECNHKLRSYDIENKWGGPFNNINAMILWLNESVDSGVNVYKEFEKIESIKFHCEEMSDISNWDPLNDEVLVANGWEVLCLKSQRSKLSPILIGVALRKLFDKGGRENYKYIVKVINEWNKDLVSACKALSVLSRSNIEELWDNNVGIRPILSLSLLNSWLNNPSEMDYWYWKPLQDISTKGGSHYDESNHSHRFLYELKTMLFNTDVSNIDIFQQVFYGAIDKKRDVLNCNNHYVQVKNKVLHQPNYKGHYGSLANKAYRELYQPLHKAINSRDPGTVQTIIRKKRESFDFNLWFEQAIKVMEHKGYVDAQHKKMIYQYMNERNESIDKWLKLEFRIKGTLVSEILTLQNMVKDLIESYSHKKSTENYMFIEMMIWWINSIKDKNGGLRITAGNPLNFSDSMPGEKFIFNDKVFLRRCIEAETCNKSEAWALYIADMLSEWSNPALKNTVLMQWKESNRIEFLLVYEKICKLSGVDISFDIAEWLKDNVVELKKKLLNDTKVIKSKLEGFQIDIKPLLIEELDDIVLCLTNGDWLDLIARTESLKDEVRDGLERYGSNERRLQICSDIEILGGIVCTNDNRKLQEIELELIKLLDIKKDGGCMVHIDSIQKLQQVPGLTEKIMYDIGNAIEAMSKPRYIPDHEQADWIRVILDTIFSPLIMHLKMRKTIIPDFIKKIDILFLAVIRTLTNPEWIVTKDTNTEVNLIELSDMLKKEDSLVDIQKVEGILAWFYAKSESLDVSVFSDDWSSALDEQSKDVSVSKFNVMQDKVTVINNAKGVLIGALDNFPVNLSRVELNIKTEDKQIEVALINKNWIDVIRLCVAIIKYEKYENLSDVFFIRAGLSLAYELSVDDRSDVIEALALIIENSSLSNISDALINKSKKFDQSLLGVVVASWVFGEKFNIERSWQCNGELSSSAAIRLARVLDGEHDNSFGRNKSNILDLLWGLSSGKKRGAEFRGCLLSICHIGNLFWPLLLLLRKDPIRMKEQRAKLFVELIQRSTDTLGSERLYDFISSERHKQSSKPFSIFSEYLLSLRNKRNDEPATIKIVGTVEKGQDKRLWIAAVLITPTVLDPPQSIVLRVNKDSVVTFGPDKLLQYNIEGPILEPKQIRITLNIKNEFNGVMTTEIRCLVKTLGEVKADYIQTWTIDAGNVDSFICPSADYVEECFSRFPSIPMRGKDFIHRNSDEKTIENILFNSTRAGSLWITSPRRSGKTSMLFRILDEFSYLKGRDDIVLYFTMSEKFICDKSFNQWIWRRIRRGRDNKKLNDYISDLDKIGLKLEMDTDIDIFLGELTEELLKEMPEGARVYYVIDEIDRFAEMYLDGGETRDIANNIMWKLKHAISNEPNMGIVFAGSHAAARFFLADASAPFYNSIDSIKLEPFNVETKANERSTREIVLPKDLKKIFTLSNDTLKHFVRITAGIPYYMKLLSGSTLASAKHSQIFPADVNEGVVNMLSKETGIKAIDRLDNPGEDELRTIYAKSAKEKALIQGVLLAVAYIRSPVHGYAINVGEIWSEKSPLVVRADLSKESIEPALKSAIDMGFLRTPTSSVYQVEFSIPLLGESMRKRFNPLWANIESQLELLRNP